MDVIQKSSGASMTDRETAAAAAAEGRPRSASGLSLRPALGSMSRMRSRSLLKGSELAVSASSSNLGQETTVRDDGYCGQPSTSSSTRQHQAILAAHTPSPSSASSSYFETDGETDGAASTLTDDSDLNGPYTPTDAPHDTASFIMGKLPFQMPRRATLSRIAAAAANPFGSMISMPPRLNRQQSYLTLSIPPTPGAGTSTSNLELRGDDEDRRLPSPVTESIEEHFTRSGLAAQPISSSSNTMPAATTLSQRMANSPLSLSKSLPPLFFLLFLFSLSLLFIYYAIATIPVLSIPHSISQIREQSAALQAYARRGWTEGIHVSAVLSALFVFKQAFSVPGSILVNILFGSLYGTYAATVCACFFTGVGSVCAYYMARLCAPLVERYFPKALATTRSALLGPNSNPGDMFSYLLLARLFPLLPYSVLNVACGVLAIPVKPYFITLVLGSFPYNFVTTQLGDLLGSLANTAGEDGTNINAIWTWDLCFKLAVASILSAAPLLFKEQLKSYLGGDSAASGPTRRSRSGTEAEKMAALAAGQSEYSSFGLRSQRPVIPLLRRDRTDSTASEILVYPPPSAPAPVTLSRQRSQKQHNPAGHHPKKWSFSWSDWRHSPTNDSGDSNWSAFSSTNSTSDGHDDGGESGDTDEEDARERRISDSRRSSRSFEAPLHGSKGQNTQRRTASVESSSAALHSSTYGSQSPGNYFFDDLPHSSRQGSPVGRSSSEWGRF